MHIQLFPKWRPERAPKKQGMEFIFINRAERTWSATARGHKEFMREYEAIRSRVGEEQEELAHIFHIGGRTSELFRPSEGSLGGRPNQKKKWSFMGNCVEWRFHSSNLGLFYGLLTSYFLPPGQDGSGNGKSISFVLMFF